MRSRSNARPRGSLLIETVVLISLVTLLLGLAAGMIHLLLKLDRGVRSSAETAADMARLAADFRRDAHAASTTEADPKSLEALTLQLDGGRTVEYLVRTNDIVRTLRQGEKVRHYDQYRRPSKATVRLEVAKEGPIRLARLVINQPVNGKDNSLYRDYRIDAVLGKDARRIGGPR